MLKPDPDQKEKDERYMRPKIAQIQQKEREREIYLSNLSEFDRILALEEEAQ